MPLCLSVVVTFNCDRFQLSQKMHFLQQLRGFNLPVGAAGPILLCFHSVFPVLSVRRKNEGHNIGVPLPSVQDLYTFRARLFLFFCISFHTLVLLHLHVCICLDLRIYCVCICIHVGYISITFVHIVVYVKFFVSYQ